MKKFFNTKLVLVGLISLVIGVVGAVGVFAAIPHSTTKVISACRSNFNGALRAIDAQNGATCNAFETGLSWSGDLTPASSSGAKTAVFHASPDPEAEVGYIYNPDRSRGIIQAKRLIEDPVNNPAGNRGYCVELGFTVRYASNLFHRNIVDAQYEALNPGIQAEIDEACGEPGFDAYVSEGGSHSGEDMIFFSE